MNLDMSGEADWNNPYSSYQGEELKENQLKDEKNAFNETTKTIQYLDKQILEKYFYQEEQEE
eukprot:CAMPEP_0170542020 /NCGR_PEP_ID=MMETSP0211-20121228/1579_1 /TAXON_ID=311385 /ORGANISM="Pseudokeronopsis sp., Strain OXSARD2" /LENGTH=61 /DNA_ID=CAMNT_0010844953 /DNA_START=1668 /DNA_END=1853 /DNA_ORIENTATION=-